MIPDELILVNLMGFFEALESGKLDLYVEGILTTSTSCMLVAGPSVVLHWELGAKPTKTGAT